MRTVYDVCIYYYSWIKVAEAYDTPHAIIIARAFAEKNSDGAEYAVLDQTGNVIFKTK